MARAQAEVDYVRQHDPERAQRDPAVAHVSKQLQLAAQAHERRRRSMALLDEVVFLARSLEVNPLQAGGRL